MPSSLKKNAFAISYSQLHELVSVKLHEPAGIKPDESASRADILSLSVNRRFVSHEITHQVEQTRYDEKHHDERKRETQDAWKYPCRESQADKACTFQKHQRCCHDTRSDVFP